MAHEPNQPCAEFEPLLIRKITGELTPEDADALANHLAQCATCNSELEKVSRLWQGMESLAPAAVPPKLHDETQKTVLSLIKQEKSFFYRFVGDSLIKGGWSYLLPVMAGLVMTALSYGLIANLIDHRIHHHHIVISVFALWAILFVVASWLMFRGKRRRDSSVSAVITSLSITFITLLLARLFSWSDVSGWIDVLFNGYVPESAHRFVIGWGSYACAAAFFGALFFGLHKATSVSGAAFLGSLLTSVLLFPVLYLHGSSHSTASA